MLLEQIFLKNLSNWVTFLWQTLIQTIKYGLNYTKRIKQKQVTSILYSFTPSDVNFQTFLLLLWFWQKRNHKESTHLDHSYLNYTADRIQEISGCNTKFLSGNTEESFLFRSWAMHFIFARLRLGQIIFIRALINCLSLNNPLITTILPSLGPWKDHFLGD